MNNTNKPEDIEIIIFFLQKLEHSDGISKYILKRQRTNENKFTFIPTKQDIEIALKELSQEKYGGKTLITNINEININNTIFNDDKNDKKELKELSTIENNNTNINNNILNTFNSYDYNQTISKGDKTNTKQEKSKDSHKGEELCKDSINLNKLINKQLIKTLNSTSTIYDNSQILRGKKNLKNNLNKTKDNNLKRKQIKNQIIPILDLQNFLNVNSDVVKEISDKLDGLAEVYLKYSKLNIK
jgi:hypothetical protein